MNIDPETGLILDDTTQTQQPSSQTQQQTQPQTQSQLKVDPETGLQLDESSPEAALPHPALISFTQPYFDKNGNFNENRGTAAITRIPDPSYVSDLQQSSLDLIKNDPNFLKLSPEQQQAITSKIAPTWNLNHANNNQEILNYLKTSQDAPAQDFRKSAGSLDPETYFNTLPSASLSALQNYYTASPLTMAKEIPEAIGDAVTAPARYLLSTGGAKAANLYQPMGEVGSENSDQNTPFLNKTINSVARSPMTYLPFAAAESPILAGMASAPVQTMRENETKNQDYSLSDFLKDEAISGGIGAAFKGIGTGVANLKAMSDLKAAGVEPSLSTYLDPNLQLGVTQNATARNTLKNFSDQIGENWNDLTPIKSSDASGISGSTAFKNARTGVRSDPGSYTFGFGGEYQVHPFESMDLGNDVHGPINPVQAVDLAQKNPGSASLSDSYNPDYINSNGQKQAIRPMIEAPLTLQALTEDMSAKGTPRTDIQLANDNKSISDLAQTISSAQTSTPSIEYGIGNDQLNAIMKSWAINNPTTYARLAQHISDMQGSKNAAQYIPAAKILGLDLDALKKGATTDLFGNDIPATRFATQSPFQTASQMNGSPISSTFDNLKNYGFGTGVIKSLSDLGSGGVANLVGGAAANLGTMLTNGAPGTILKSKLYQDLSQ